MSVLFVNHINQSWFNLWKKYTFSINIFKNEKYGQVYCSVSHLWTLASPMNTTSTNNYWRKQDGEDSNSLVVSELNLDCTLGPGVQLLQVLYWNKCQGHLRKISSNCFIKKSRGNAHRLWHIKSLKSSLLS